MTYDLRKFAIIVFFCSFVFNTAQASEIDWDFSAHPQPELDDLTEPEENILKKSDEDISPEPGACQKAVYARFEIYKLRYPQFAILANERTRYREWTENMTLKPPYVASHCLALIAEAKLIDLMHNNDGFFFCGVPSRKPVTEKEHKITELSEKLIIYAQSGDDSAVGSLLGLNDFSPELELAPELEYYFRNIRNPRHPGRFKPRDVSHLIPKLDDEIRARLDKAAAERDISVPKSMIKSCSRFL